MSPRRLLCAIAVCLCLSSSVLAGTRMIFPRILVQQQGRWSGIAIVNPNSTDASITLKAYNPDGTQFSGNQVVNPATGTVPAGGQYLKLGGQIFLPADTGPGNPTPTRLWVEVTSDANGLTGFFLEGNDSITSLYGGDLGTFGTDLFLPAVQNSGSNVTEISLVNADTADANITVDFLRADGTKVDSKSAVVPKGGALQGPLSNVSGFNIAYDQVAALRIHSDRPVVCYGVVSRPGDNTPTALSAVDTTVPAQILYFPQLADGGGWSTGIGIVNLDFANSTLVTLTAYKEDGTLFAAAGMTNPVTQLISQGGFLHTTVRSLFGFSGQSLQVGWIKVEASDPAISGFVEYGTANSHALVTAQLNAAQVSMFSHQANSSPYYTGLAVLNPGSLTANVEVFSLNATGDIIGKAQHVLRPGQKESLVMQQWISATDGKTGGSVFLRTDRPVIATQLFGTAQSLANVPPQPVTTGYSPRNDPGKISPTPLLAVVETGKTQQFQTGTPGIDWYVNGLKGGSSTVGTISSTGLYQAPTVAPAPHSLTIEATTTAGDRSGGSSIDVVQRETLVGGLKLVTAVAYLDNLKRFFLAEQQVISSAPTARVNATTSNATISEVLPDDTKSTFLQVPGDTIAKMLPFVDSGNSYLLLAGHDSGKVYRLDVGTKILATVASGLNQPDSLALDPITGSLLVAEAGAGQITVIPRPQILSATASTPALRAAAPRVGAILPVPGVVGIAIDACTGTVYATLASGEVHEFQGSLDRVVASNLDRPGQLIALYRDGLSCKDGLTLAVLERTRISLIYPKTQLPQTTLIDNLQNLLDITFFPKGNPFTRNGEEAVTFADQGSGADGNISQIPVGGSYQFLPPITLGIPGSTGSIGPNDDPVGDTFDWVGNPFSPVPQFGYSIPDIVSVTGSVEGSSSVITIKFNNTVTLGGPPTGTAPPPDGVWAFIFVKTTAPATVDLPPGLSLPSFFPFGDTSLFVFDTWVELFLGQATYVSFNQLAAGNVQVSAIGNTLTLTVPASALPLSGALAVVVVGNPAEMTDVAPNNGVIKLSP